MSLNPDQKYSCKPSLIHNSVKHVTSFLLLRHNRGMTKQMDLGIYLHTKVAVVSVILKKGFSKSERDHVAPSSGTWKLHDYSISPFPSCRLPRFQSESLCTTIQMEIIGVFSRKSNSLSFEWFSKQQFGWPVKTRG